MRDQSPNQYKKLMSLTNTEAASKIRVGKCNLVCYIIMHIITLLQVNIFSTNIFDMLEDIAIDHSGY